MSADQPPSDPNHRRATTGSESRPILAEDLQLAPSAPAPPPIPPITPALANGAPPEILDRVRRSPLATKLRLLLRCHELAARTRRLRAWIRFGTNTAVISLGVVLGVLAGLGVFFAVYDNPEQYTQSYFDRSTYTYTYFVKGQNKTQQEYDYFLATHSNLSTAVAAAIAVGLAVVAVFAGSLLLRSRRLQPPAVGVEEQIAAIVSDHADAVRDWGGPSVLREPHLVAEVLRIEEKNGR
ncbi:MAG TPA: hypothetical protein VMS17_31855 [Gemmataceae bacterium]|nr:hypothetical protein [Gemmataceae bacterium]